MHVVGAPPASAAADVGDYLADFSDFLIICHQRIKVWPACPQVGRAISPRSRPHAGRRQSSDLSDNGSRRGKWAAGDLRGAARYAPRFNGDKTAKPRLRRLGRRGSSGLTPTYRVALRAPAAKLGLHHAGGRLMRPPSSADSLGRRTCSALASVAAVVQIASAAPCAASVSPSRSQRIFSRGAWISNRVIRTIARSPRRCASATRRLAWGSTRPWAGAICGMHQTEPAVDSRGAANRRSAASHAIGSGRRRRREPVRRLVRCAVGLLSAREPA